MIPLLVLLASCIFSAAASGAGHAFLESELIFPLDVLHNHSSSVVELSNGDLLTCWYRGSGERTADDVMVMAARKRRGAKEWEKPFVLTDTPGFPDTNPVLFMDSKQRLWLMWALVVANRWETSLLEYRIVDSYKPADQVPKWDVSGPVLFQPRNFEVKVKSVAEPWLAKLPAGRLADEVRKAITAAGDKYATRMGWMPRVHPLELPSGRIVVPLYSDGFDFSLMALTDDGGRTWQTSEPLVSMGGVQPSVVRRRDGTLFAYMRDNGPPPKRAMVSHSKDNGETWSPVVDSDIPNPGSSLEVISLREGSWVMVYNDTEKGRHSLAVALSEDEGASWKWKRHLELDQRETDAGSFHYPSVIQTRDGSVHVTYSYYRNDVPKKAPSQSIKHARFNVDWIKNGDR